MAANDPLAPAPAVPAAPGRLRRAADAVTLKCHELADRWEMLPDEFGREGGVDEADPAALRREYLRCLRHWSSYNPEQLFAIKVGLALLAAAMLMIWAVVGLLR